MSAVLSVSLSFSAGIVLGVLHFASLRALIRCFLEARRRWWVGVAQVLRVACVGAVFMVIAQSGALPLLAAFAGLLVARSVIVRCALEESR